MKNKILVVDDNDINVEIFQELLQEDYILATADCGEKCLEKISEFDPDVVLLDIMMPGIGGYETCRRIKAGCGSQLPQIVLVSAESSIESRLKGYQAGADDYIVRPLDNDELAAKIRVQIRLREALTNLESMHKQLSLQNAKLEELVRQRTTEVVETRDLVVFALAKLAESRDPETGEHLERMQKYSHILTMQLANTHQYKNEIDKQFIENLYRASPLHDIGKVGIPDAILLKPGRLSASEFENLKQHTTIGEDAIKKATKHGNSGGFLEMGADIARAHHERFNGSGYPDGLSGEDISLAARIVALADVYDALTSIRVYKTALEPEVARSMIIEETGKHFDPIIVDAFCAGWEELLHVRALVDNSMPELVDAAVSRDIRR